MPFDDELLENPEPGPEFNALTQAVIGAAIEVHRILGAGLDEGCYAQLNTYLKITRLTLGLLINFNVLLLKDGIRRVIRSDRN